MTGVQTCALPICERRLKAVGCGVDCRTTGPLAAELNLPTQSGCTVVELKRLEADFPVFRRGVGSIAASTLLWPAITGSTALVGARPVGHGAVCLSLPDDRRVQGCRSGLPIRTARNPGIARRSLNAAAAQGVQFLNLKLAMRVFQLKLPVVAMYCCVYQKVQSSVGSMLIEL